MLLLRRLARPRPGLRGLAADAGDGRGAAAAGGDEGAAAPPPTDPPARVRRRKPTRAATGSWAVSAELDAEFAGRAVPPGANVYDMRATFPYFYAPRGGALVGAAASAAIEAGAAAADPSPPPPRPGARKIVRWETTVVLHPGPDDAGHPRNRKASARVHLADLASEAGLTAAAAAHIALVCGPRYDPGTGTVRLTEERHAARADNVAAVRATLAALVAEGRRRHPAP
jgi:hypothetical protein